ncbi:MAG: hypothetical protein Q8P50_15285 [Bacillota bacterium]|nr:hypothetical protein [Bacillota bacterium]
MAVKQGDIVRTDLGFFKVVFVSRDGCTGVPVVREGPGYRETSTRPMAIRASEVVEVVYPRYSRVRWNP